MISILALASCSSSDSKTGDDGAAGHGGHGGTAGSGGDDGTAGSGGDDGTAGSGGEDGTGGTGGDDGTGGTGGDDGEAGSGGEEHGCREPGPADRERIVVVGVKGSPVIEGSFDHYQVLRLTEDGALEATGKIFEMGQPSDDPIVFTPDGKLGFAPQSNGTVGVFRVADDGEIEVLDPALGAGRFYAGQLVMSPAGDHLFVNDVNWPDNGGGLYRVDIGCDDSLTIAGRIIASKSARGLVLLPGDEAIFGAREVDGFEPHDIFRVSLADPAATIAGLDLFPYSPDDWSFAWISSMGLMPDGKHLLVGDNNEYTELPNSVAIVEVGETTLEHKGAIEIEDPYSMATSPFGDAAIVVSGYGDNVFVLDYDATADVPFALRGAVEYVGGRPQVPGKLAMVARGSQQGRVLIPDVRGLFQVKFGESATVTDLGLFRLERIPSNVGVQP
ncbi:hypothetical protein [Vulgatibacter incomptus]|uniref:hypothetical protein n=1 Tax=Vulgatibacter incomptus TaxID=1391653 RepID=UPI0012FB3056|nr:hypothetical protein [Vulgatibacter incomptus]